VSIPIHNLYYLLVYAWDVLDESSIADVGTESIDVPQELFGRILCNGIDHLLKRGLDRDYSTETSEIPGVRGRIEISSTIKANSMSKGRLVCTYDELTHDVLHNQILKATLRSLVHTIQIDKEFRQDIRGLLRKFEHVSDIELANDTFRRVQLHSNNRFYRILLQVCRLLHKHLIPDQSQSGFQFVEFTEEQLQTVFESFIRNFYRREQSIYKVKREKFAWHNVETDSASLPFLPKMETDASLKSDSNKIIIEVKYYKSPLTRHQRGGKQVVRSAHLYQLFSYIKNRYQESDVPVEGLLLYAKNKEDIDLDYTISGHRLRVATVDLMEPAEDIRDRLLQLVS